MPWRTMIVLLASTLVAGQRRILSAQDGATPSAAPPPAAQGSAAQGSAAEDIAALIQTLDDNRFSKRQDASRRLKELGEAAIPALLEASRGESREASSRAFEILKQHFQAGEGPLKDAARTALRTLADSDRAPLARKAEEALNPPQEPPVLQMAPLGGGAQVQVQIRIGGAQQVQVRNVNGVRDIEVQEQDRAIKIHEDPHQGITVEIKEKKDGKDVTEKFEAKDALELKNKHPEAHKLYEKYNQGGQIQIQAVQIPAAQIQGLPIQPFGGRVLPRAVHRQAEAQPNAEQLERISSQLRETEKLLEQLRTNPQQIEPLQQALERLRKAQQELQEALHKIR